MTNEREKKSPKTVVIEGCKAHGASGKCTLEWCRKARGEWCRGKDGWCKWRFV